MWLPKITHCWFIALRCHAVFQSLFLHKFVPPCRLSRKSWNGSFCARGGILVKRVSRPLRLNILSNLLITDMKMDFIYYNLQGWWSCELQGYFFIDLFSLVRFYSCSRLLMNILFHIAIFASGNAMNTVKSCL